MTEFKESEHPRDDNGKFIDGNKPYRVRLGECFEERLRVLLF